jgi:hypothetical protein
MIGLATVRSRQKFGQRRGTVLVAALVCLLIVMAMLGSMLQGTLRSRRQMHRHRDLVQCELLLQAGTERAVFQFSQDSDYRGEAWSLPATDIVGSAEGQVTIAASRAADDKPWQLHVVAEYPLGGETSIRRSRTILVSQNSTQAQE